MGIAELEAEVLKLSPEEQARLLHRLAVVLDGTEETELTNVELERRWADFQSGNEPGIEAAALRERALRRYGLS